MRLSLLAALVGCALGVYITHGYMGGKISELHREQLAREAELHAAQTAHQATLLERVAEANNATIVSLTEQIGAINDQSSVVVTQVAQVVPQSNTGRISRGAVQLLNDAFKRTDSNYPRVPKTPRLSDEEARSDSTIDQRALVEKLIRSLNQYAAEVARYRALIDWINTSYPVDPTPLEDTGDSAGK